MSHGERPGSACYYIQQESELWKEGTKEIESLTCVLNMAITLMQRGDG